MRHPSLKALWVIIPLSILSLSSSNNSKKLTYQILEGSNLSISGSSNVHDFTCACQQDFIPDVIEMDIPSKKIEILFSRTDLHITTKTLDCGKKLMNQDMYETLKADEYPFITITLKKAIQDPEYCLSTCINWVEMNVIAEISIAGTCKLVPLFVEAKQIEEDSYRFVSSTKLQMTDFNIEPPEALMGMIKVSNDITIELDLSVRVLESGWSSL